MLTPPAAGIASSRAGSGSVASSMRITSGIDRPRMYVMLPSRALAVEQLRPLSSAS